MKNTEIFSSRALGNQYVYQKHAAVVLTLHEKANVVLPNKHAEDIRWVSQRADLTSQVLTMMHQECRRFANLAPLKGWRAGSLLCSTSSCEVELLFSR